MAGNSDSLDKITLKERVLYTEQTTVSYATAKQCMYKSVLTIIFIVVTCFVREVFQLLKYN